jgi:hypothetical protein
VPMLEKYGPVRVVDVDGKPVRASDAPAAPKPAAQAAPGGGGSGPTASQFVETSRAVY